MNGELRITISCRTWERFRKCKGNRNWTSLSQAFVSIISCRLLCLSSSYLLFYDVSYCCTLLREFLRLTRRGSCGKVPSTHVSWFRLQSFMIVGDYHRKCTFKSYYRSLRVEQVNQPTWIHSDFRFYDAPNIVSRKIPALAILDSTIFLVKLFWLSSLAPFCEPRV